MSKTERDAQIVHDMVERMMRKQDVQKASDNKERNRQIYTELSECYLKMKKAYDDLDWDEDIAIRETTGCLLQAINHLSNANGIMDAYLNPE